MIFVKSQNFSKFLEISCLKMFQNVVKILQKYDCLKILVFFDHFLVLLFF